MSFPVTEVQAQLRKSGSVTLNSSGNGVITFDPDNARQRWEVTSVIVSTNQAAAATVVPVATVALNTADITILSSGNNRGASWSGNQDTFQGQIDVGPCDFLTVAFSPAPGTADKTVSGSATGPGAFQTIISFTFPVGGLWTIGWTVTLAGTPGSADANNMRLIKNSSTFLVESVNAGAAGTYPQAAYQAAFNAGDSVQLTVGPTNASAGAVYSGTLDVGSPLAGVIASAVVTGSKFTRRS
jgi:hypothetical protein